jgi:methylated-DNA-[protein]-cysteine S-methyltransferase
MDQKLDKITFVKSIDSPFGNITITTNETHLLSLNLNLAGDQGLLESSLPPIMTNTLAQLDGYFKKTHTTFDLPMDPVGTDFQKKVWQTLQTIKFGCTISYQKLAEQIENISKTRAVAAAIAKNPILIILPCHRVIGTNGKLTGYSGGIDKKRQLLIHEEPNNNRNILLF